jgi:filamentous hemagglutinin family protein
MTSTDRTSTARPSALPAASTRSAVTSCPGPRNLARFGLRAAVAALLAWSPAAKAEVVLDGTLGRAGALAGPEFQIRAEHGRRAGRNLFHSFRSFNLAHGERATFSGPGAIRHVIGRVTGGGASSIDGTLASSIPGADLWLLNPAGLLFGPNARLDVRGSFHASTAAELRFADGAVFRALDPNGSVLSVAEPQAFGFLRRKPGRITVDRSVLEVPEREALSLVGGAIAVTAGNTGVASGGTAGVVFAASGQVTLAALGGPGSADVNTGQVTGEASADVRLTDQAVISTSGDGGGTIRIRSGQLVVENRSFIVADNHGPTDARGGIAIEAGAVRIDAGSFVDANVRGSGDAGRLSIRADAVEVRAGSRVESFALQEGDAGSVTVAASRVLVSGGHVRSIALGEGDAGKVV